MTFHKAKFLYILYKSGCISWGKLLSYFPQPTSFAIKFLPGVEVYGQTDIPDDDFCVYFNSIPHKTSFRNQKYTRADNVIYTPCKVGDKVKVEIVDTHPNTYISRKWEVTITYTDNSTWKITGGQDKQGTSTLPLPDPIPPDYWDTEPVFIQRYPNGSFTIPPPTQYQELLKFTVDYKE